jgi:hypothetical protein
MRRFRIDFTIREVDCPPEDARGITFGDDVDVNSIFDFFNRCRDAAVTLFNGPRPKDLDTEWNELSREIEETKKKAKQAGVPIVMAAQKPCDDEHRMRWWAARASGGRGLSGDS